jgi:cytochrome P450
MALGNTSVRDFAAYLKGLVDDRRQNPRDPEKDLLTRLIRHEHEGRKLSEPELLQNCIFILNAGHETTTNLIGNTLDILIRFPAERRRLIENPSLMKSAVEEALRYESSNQLGNRIVTEETMLGGVRCRRARWSPSASARPTATANNSPTLIVSTPRAIRRAISPSARASICAPA